MVSGISGNSQILNNYPIEGQNQVASGAKVAENPAVKKTVDSMETVSGQGIAFEGKAGLNLPAAIKMPAATAGSVTELDVAVVAAGASRVDELTDELKLLFKDNPEAAKALKELLGNKDFISLDDDAQVAVLSQCKNFPNANSVNKLGKMVGASWFKNQGINDMQRSAKSIAYLAETAKKTPGSNQETIIENTLGRLLSGEIPLAFVDITDEPNKITYGYAINGEKGIYINRKLVPSGNEEFPKWDYQAEEAVLSTIPHETSHQVNNDKNRINYKYFQAEYRAWYVGYVARFGVEPTRQQAFDRSVEIIGIYDTINDAVYGGNIFARIWDYIVKFFTGDPLESTKILNFLNQMVGLDEIDESTDEAKDTFLNQPVKDPWSVAPLPDSQFNPDMDN